MKHILALLLALVAFGADAQIYINKCDAGSHALCSTLTGSDANPGTSPSAPKLNIPSEFSMSQAAAGTTYRLCNGGSWTGMTSRLIKNDNATFAAPLRFERYDCGNGVPVDSTTRPILESASNASAQWIIGEFDATNGTAASHGGYVFKGLYIKGPFGNGGNEAFKVYGSTRWLTWDDMRIEGWAGCAELTSTQNLKNITFKNSICSNNSANGVFGNADDLLIENNVFDRNNNQGAPSGGSFALEHALYVGGAEPHKRVTIRRNTITNSSTDTSDNTCKSGNITTRGNISSLTIEENIIVAPAGDSSCYGISVIDAYTALEHIYALIIRGNIVVNVGSNSIAVNLCDGCLVENNTIVRNTSTGGHNGISIDNPSDSAELPASTPQNGIVRNNSCDIGSGSGGYCVRVAAGTGHKVLNNLSIIRAGATSTNCWSHTALANFAIWNGNWCYELGSGQWSATYATLALAQAAGFDVNGGNTDPVLVSTPGAGNGYSMAVQSSSPLRGAGRTTDMPVRDALWCQRAAPPTVGAYEYGGTPCLSVRSPVRN